MVCPQKLHEKSTDQYNQITTATLLVKRPSIIVLYIFFYIELLTSFHSVMNQQMLF